VGSDAACRVVYWGFAEALDRSIAADGTHAGLLVGSHLVLR